MSSPEYEPSLRIEPQRSRILLLFLLFNFSGTTLILFLVLPLMVAIIISILLWAYFYRLYQCHVLRRSATTIDLLVREADGEWLMYTQSGSEHEVLLSPSCYVHPQLIILILMVEGTQRVLPLLPDSLSSECFRALLARLKTES